MDHRRALAIANATASLKNRNQWHLGNICLRRDILVTLMQFDFNLERKANTRGTRKIRQSRVTLSLFFIKTSIPMGKSGFHFWSEQQLYKFMSTSFPVSSMQTVNKESLEKC